MERRDILLAGTAGIAALAGCSGSGSETEPEPSNDDSDPGNELESEIRTLVEDANADIEQGSRNLGDAQGFVNQERWGNVEGSAGDAADSFSDAESHINTAINRAEELDDNEIVDYLEDYQSFARAATSAATSFEQGAESMVEGDPESAESHFERAEEDLDEMESYESDIEDADI